MIDREAVHIREKAVLEVFDHSGDAPRLVKVVETVHQDGKLISREVMESPSEHPKDGEG